MGVGTLANPWQICDCYQLQNVDNYLGGNFTLVDDIDCSDTQNWNSGAGFDPIGTSSSPYFTGKLNASGYTISNLFINRSATSYIGFFTRLSGLTIEGISLENVSISGGQYTGGLIGYVSSSGNIDNCTITGSVNGSSYVGGLVGYFSSSSGYLNASSFDGDVVSSGNYAGGISAYFDSNMGWCRSSGIVTGSQYAGGLVAYLSSSSINESYSNSTVTGTYRIGGLVGYSSVGSYVSCYSSGFVNGSVAAGGLVGHGLSSSATACYWDNETSNQTSSYVGIGKTTSELQTPTSNTGIYLNWSTSVWDFGTATDYPKFIWE
ncbi:hypothetical protein H6501_00010 [Candidatus Woesearchaeota archaeon]|nr:hypothetical protein [Candidatus Woesearchaeota archaeon]